MPSPSPEQHHDLPPSETTGPILPNVRHNNQDRHEMSMIVRDIPMHFSASLQPKESRREQQNLLHPLSFELFSRLLSLNHSGTLLGLFL